MVKFEKSAGAIIFYIEKGKILYLLLKYPSYWGFVKGVIEKNETEEKTIRREAKEETGLSDLFFIPGFKEKTNWFYKLKGELIRKEAVFLLAETKNKNIRLSFEHEDYKWCSLDEALKLIKIKSNKQIIEKANSFLQKYLNQSLKNWI